MDDWPHDLEYSQRKRTEESNRRRAPGLTQVRIVFAILSFLALIAWLIIRYFMGVFSSIAPD